jgi:hypothetical protein
MNLISVYPKVLTEKKVKQIKCKYLIRRTNEKNESRSGFLEKFLISFKVNIKNDKKRASFRYTILMKPLHTD